MKTHTVNLNLEALPRSFILDDRHRVIMADDPADLDNMLPAILGRAVAVLAERCMAERIRSKVARLGSYHVKVQLLQSTQTVHTQVTVDRAA